MSSNESTVQRVLFSFKDPDILVIQLKSELAKQRSTRKVPFNLRTKSKKVPFNQKAKQESDKSTVPIVSRENHQKNHNILYLC